MPKYLLIQNKITMKETVLVTLVADDKQKKNRLLKTLAENNTSHNVEKCLLRPWRTL